MHYYRADVSFRFSFLCFVIMNYCSALQSKNMSTDVQVIPKKNCYEGELKWSAWPSLYGRSVEGGTDDKPRKEVHTFDNDTEFFTRIDGDSVIESENDFVISTKTDDEAKIEHSVSNTNALLIPPGISYAFPKGTYTVWSRKTGSANISQRSAPTQELVKLPSDFGKEKEYLSKAPVQHVDTVVYSSIDLNKGTFVTTDGAEKELVTAESYPSVPESESQVGTLVQKFSMQWIDEGDTKEILFKGETGSLAGKEGRPGVVFNKANDTVSVNLLLSRPDGSFLITSSNTVCMVVAPPNNDGNPDVEHLRVAKFAQGVKLPPGWWHSVPFPHPKFDKLELTEIVAETNANVVINLTEEIGRPFVFNLYLQ